MQANRNTKDNKRTNILYVRLTPDEVATLDEICTRESRRRTDQIRFLINRRAVELALEHGVAQ